MEVTTAAAPMVSTIRRRRRRRGAIAGLLVLLLASVFHAPLLRGLGSALVYDQPLPSQAVQYVLIRSQGDRRYDMAAELIRSGKARGALLIEAYPEPLVREGILPTRETRSRQLLRSRGVPESDVQVISGRARNDWHADRLLADWLHEQPETSLIMLCDRFDSSRQYRILASMLSKEELRAVYIRALPDRRFNEQNWWQTRAGLKWVFTCGIRTIYDQAVGEPVDSGHDFDPDAYERQFKESLAIPAKTP